MVNSKSNLAGWVGIVLYVLALVNFYQDQLWVRLDHKDLFWAGTGLLLIAIWQSLGGPPKE